jgi:hypothetical protein
MYFVLANHPDDADWHPCSGVQHDAPATITGVRSPATARRRLGIIGRQGGSGVWDAPRNRPVENSAGAAREDPPPPDARQMTPRGTASGAVRARPFRSLRLPALASAWERQQSSTPTLLVSLV